MIPFTDAHTHHTYSDGTGFIYSAGMPEAVPEIPFSAGIHPVTTDAAWNPAVFLSEKCMAAGECGLDRRSSLSLKEQEQLFLAHLAIAEERRLPVIIHCVRMQQELLRIRKNTTSTVPWIIHGCRGSERKIMELVQAGMILSFGEGLLRDAGNLAPFFSAIPLDSILLETDEAPGGVLPAIYAEAASMRMMNGEDFRLAVYQNFQRIFYHGK